MKDRLANRQIMILNFLLENNHTTYKELAEQLQVSTRTISKDVFCLKEIVNKVAGVQIVVQPRKGVSLVGEMKYLRSVLSDFKITTIDTPEDRITYVFAKLLNTNKYLKIQKLADQLFISRTTMESTIKEVKKRLKTHNIDLISNRNGLKLESKEMNKRKLMSEVLNYYWGGLTASCNKSNLLDLNISLLGEGNIFLDKNIFKNVVLTLNRYMEERQLKFTDYEFQTLAIHLSIALERIKSNNFLSQNCETNQEISYNTKYLVNMLEEMFELNIPVYEQVYMNIHIHAIEKNAMNYVLDEGTIPILDMGKQIKRIVIEELSDFSLDDEFMNNLILHLNTAVKRLKLGVNINNPYTEKIKSSFKQAFFISFNLLDKMEEHFKVDFNDDEIAYVALHIQSVLELHKTLKTDVILVCSSGYGTAKLLEQRIKRNFFDSINIKKTLSISELQEEKIDDELVISTIPIENAKFPVVVVSPLVLSTDVNRIRRYLNISGSQEDTFFSLLDKRFFFFSNKKEDTQNNVLQIITKHLQAENYAKPGILESSVRREKLSSTALGDFSMPHAEITYVNEPVISVYVNPQGIKWGETIIHIVFFFALNGLVKHELNGLYETFNQIISNQSTLTNLKASHSFEELVMMLKEGYK